MKSLSAKSWSAAMTGVLVLAVTVMASFPLSGNVGNPLDDKTYSQVTEEMNRVTTIVREGRTHIDRSAFDFEARLDDLDYDADTIIGFARRSIAFEQYPGSLRGPRGTLLSLAGNALDQSLLLGKLLRDAGYDARIARATLDDATASALLKQMAHPASASESVHISPQLAISLAKLAGDRITPTALLEQFASSENPETDPDYQKVRETTRFLRSALDDAGIDPGPPGARPALVEEARDYFWVQYKDLAADGWTDVHPAFVDDPPDTMPEPAQFISGAVPEDLLHRVRLQFFIERSRAGKLETIPISEAWERPVANLVDTPVFFSVIPTGISTDTIVQKGLAEALEASSIFATVFNGSAMPGGMYFDLKGNTVDPMAASSAAAGVFATVGDRVGSAVNELGGDTPKLTAHWIQITQIAPDGTETSYRRTTMDRIGPAARAGGAPPPDLAPTSSEDALHLLHKHTIMIAAGRTPVSLMVDRNFEWMLRAEPMYRQLQEQVAYRAHENLEAPELKPVEDLPAYWPGHLSLLSMFDRAHALVESHRIYRASPGIVMHIQGQSGTEALFEMVDIVTNARRAVAIDQDTPRLDPEAAIVAGVWDTAKEGALLKPGDTRVDTQTVFTNAMADGKRLVTLPPGKPVSGMALSPDIQALVESDLSRGFAVVLPDGQDLLEGAAWWRVNPETGETVGQARDGRGAAATETLAVLATAVTTIAALYGLDQCHQAYQRCNDLRFPIEQCTDEYICCNGWSFLTTIVGVFAFASNALGSMVYDTGTTVGPSICP